MRGNCRVIEYLKVEREYIVLELRLVNKVRFQETSSKWLLPYHWNEVYKILRNAARDHLVSNGLWKESEVIQGEHVTVAFHFETCLPSYTEVLMPYECSAASPEDALSDAGDAWLQCTPHRDMLVAVVIPNPSVQDVSPLPEIGIGSTPKGNSFGKKSSFFIDSCKKRNDLKIAEIIPESDSEESLEKASEDLKEMWDHFRPPSQDVELQEMWENSDDSECANSEMLIDRHCSPPLDTDKGYKRFDFHKSIAGCSDNKSEVSMEDLEFLFTEKIKSEEESTDIENVAEASHAHISSPVHTASLALGSDSDSGDEHITNTYLFHRPTHGKPKIIGGGCEAVLEPEDDVKSPKYTVFTSNSEAPQFHSIFTRTSPQDVPNLSKKRRKLFKGNQEDIAQDLKTLKKIKSNIQKKKKLENPTTKAKISKKITEYFHANDTKTENKRMLHESTQKINHGTNIDQDKPFPNVLKAVNRPTSQIVEIENVKSTPDKIIVVDDGTDDEGLNNELSYDLKRLSFQHLDIVFKRNKYYLHKLFKGKIECHRHSQYKLGGHDRGKLQYSIATVPFTNSQLEHMVNLIIDTFCKETDPLQFLDYILKVLLPELATKIFMDRYNLDHDEALEKMHHVYVASNLENETL